MKFPRNPIHYLISSILVVLSGLVVVACQKPTTDIVQESKEAPKTENPVPDLTQICQNLKNEFKLDTDEDNKNKDYRNFSMNSQKKRESLNHGEYITNGFKGNGRGFGDVDISASLRYGQDARKERKTARTQDLKDYRFHHMYPSFNDENNTVLPFARGGIDTRNLEIGRAHV